MITLDAPVPRPCCADLVRPPGAPRPGTIRLDPATERIVCDPEAAHPAWSGVWQYFFYLVA